MRIKWGRPGRARWRRRSSRSPARCTSRPSVTGVRGFGFSPSPTRVGGGRDAGRSRVLLQPRLGARPGAGRGRRGDVRRVQPRGRRAARRDGLGVATRRRDLRGAHRRRGRPARAYPRAEPDGPRATELLQRANDPLRPEGRPLYAGLLGLGLPGDPIGDMWRLADRLREFRGDAHIAAWSGAGFDATEIGLLTELYWGLPMRTYIRHARWSETDLDAAEARSKSGGSWRTVGSRRRPRGVEQVEVVTDQLCRPIIEALGDDFDELVGWSGLGAGASRPPAATPARAPTTSPPWPAAADPRSSRTRGESGGASPLGSRWLLPPGPEE